MKLLLKNTSEAEFIEWLKHKADQQLFQVGPYFDFDDQDLTQGVEPVKKPKYYIYRVTPMCVSFNNFGEPFVCSPFTNENHIRRLPKTDNNSLPLYSPLPEGESYLVPWPFGNEMIDVFLQKENNDLSIDLVPIERISEDMLSEILDQMAAEWPDTRETINQEWYGQIGINEISNGKPGRKPKDISQLLPAVLKWELLKGQMNIEDFLGETFGEHPNGDLKVSKSTFYEGRKKIMNLQNKPD